MYRKQICSKENYRSDDISISNVTLGFNSWRHRTMAVYWPLEGGWDSDITSERWNLDPRAKAVWVYRSGIGRFRVPFPPAVYPDQIKTH